MEVCFFAGLVREQLTIAASRLLTSTSGAAVIVRMPKQGTPLSEKVAKNNQKTERGVQERRESKVDCKRWNPQSRLVDNPKLRTFYRHTSGTAGRCLDLMRSADDFQNCLRSTRQI
ncbi:hypothetical protein HPB50_027703 [Hyalomma asiaticum]|nr:hypothetical protein HPB50_027703 [Hyalomma asiaticum]